MSQSVENMSHCPISPTAKEFLRVGIRQWIYMYACVYPLLEVSKGTSRDKKQYLTRIRKVSSLFETCHNT